MDNTPARPQEGEAERQNLTPPTMSKLTFRGETPTTGAVEACTAAEQVTPEELAAAEAMFAQGRALRHEDPEKAVQLLSGVLNTRVKAHGEMALECASAYFEYGQALFELAQQSSDILGDTVRQAADEKAAAEVAAAAAEGDTAQGDPGAGTSAAAGAGAASGSSSGDEGDATDPAAHQERDAMAQDDGEGDEEADDSESEGEGEEEEGEEEGEGGEEGEAGGDADAARSDAAPAEGAAMDTDAPGGGGRGGSPPGEGEEGVEDMALAWELLETARLIYERAGEDAHASVLADVHSTLGDIFCEQERFEEAQAEYAVSVRLLRTLGAMQRRRLAEAHFKEACALQFLDEPDQALTAITSATAILRACVSQLQAEMRQEAGPGEDAAAHAAAQAERGEEVAALRSVLEDMDDKAEELRAAAASHASMKQTLVAAMLAAAGGGGGGAGAGVQDLGVVGGGRRVAAVPVAVGGGGAGASGGAVGGAAQQQPPKRSLESLMGGEAGAAEAGGFGASCNSLNLPPSQAPGAKRQRQEPAAGGEVENLQ